MGKTELMQYVEDLVERIKSSPNSRLAIPSLSITKSKKVTKNVSRTSRALSCSAEEVVPPRPLLSVRLPTALAWSACSPLPVRSLSRLTSTNAVPSAEQEFSTSAILPVRKPVLKRRDSNLCSPRYTWYSESVQMSGTLFFMAVHLSPFVLHPSVRGQVFPKAKDMDY